jgi:hypothetical protein
LVFEALKGAETPGEESFGKTKKTAWREKTSKVRNVKRILSVFELR